MGEIDLLRKDLNELRLEITLIKEQLSEEEGLEVSDAVVKEVNDSRDLNGEDLVSHEEVLKRYCK